MKKTLILAVISFFLVACMSSGPPEVFKAEISGDLDKEEVVTVVADVLQNRGYVISEVSQGVVTTDWKEDRSLFFESPNRSRVSVSIIGSQINIRMDKQAYQEGLFEDERRWHSKNPGGQEKEEALEIVAELEKRLSTSVAAEN